MNITSCSVKVMRSFDYCHFEVALSADAESYNGTTPARDTITVEQIDELRKTAARLADKAVRQYMRRKRAHTFASQSCHTITKEDGRSIFPGREEIFELARVASEKAEPDRTSDDKAIIKVAGDIRHEMGYDYQDDGYDDDERD